MTNLPDTDFTPRNSIRIIASLLTILGSSIVSIGFITADLWYLGVVSISALIIWILGLYFAWYSALTFLFVIQSLLIGAGLLLDVPKVWMLGGYLFLLGAWDLSVFWKRFRLAGQIVNPFNLIQRHYLRLTAVLLIGAILITISLATQISLEFGWLAGIALLMMIGLSLGIRQLLRSSDQV